MAKIINGKAIAATLQKKLISEVGKMKDMLKGFQPGLAIVQVNQYLAVFDITILVLYKLFIF